MNVVGPALRSENIFVAGGPRAHHGGNLEYRVNERVNNMSQQQFEDHMNELYMRDNQKPISAGILSQLPRTRYQADDAQKSKEDCERECTICMSEFA